VLGLLLVLCGTTAIAYPFLSSVGVVVLLGIVLIMSGVISVIDAFWASKWSAFFLQLLVGILYIVAGITIREGSSPDHIERWTPHVMVTDGVFGAGADDFRICARVLPNGLGHASNAYAPP